MISKKREGKTDYNTAFERRVKYVRGEKPWLRSLRQAAIARFSELGFPTTKLEDWKYTNTQPIEETCFQFAQKELVTESDLRELRKGFLGKQSWCRLVFVDGRFYPELSNLNDLPKGVRIDSLKRALENGFSGRLESYLSKLAGAHLDALTALNTALFDDGALIYIPKGVEFKEPIHLLHISFVKAEPAAFFPRHVVIMEERSQASVIEQYVSETDGIYFNDAVTEIFLESNARLEHFKLQEESLSAFHVSRIQARLAKESQLFSTNVTLGAKLSRLNLAVMLEGEGAECKLNGLYMLARDQHADHMTVIDHQKPKGTSRQIYKGILDGNSRGVFNGRIFVRQDAQKTDAHQTNKNILLSERASVDTKPQLEISADDVRCTHGAAVGQLDEEQLFYLKSRGLTSGRASALLAYGFAHEIIDQVSIEALRTNLGWKFWEKLRQKSF